jgi:hypothetical protein
MSSIQVSRLLRLALETRFAGEFNANLAQACTDFGIDGLIYLVNFTEADSSPQNFFRGNWNLDGLMQLREPDLPALTMWTGPGAQYGPGQREMPRNFSGFVFAYWRFFLAVQGRASGLTDLREATESAMVATLVDEFSEVTYRGDLAWQPLNEQVWLDRDNQAVGFVQEVEYQASFEVNV